MVRMTEAEVKEILIAHEKWLKGESEGIRANLSGVDLSGMDFSYATLAHANLSDANLSDANLVYANLLGANLLGANLLGADLVYANLPYANISYANLSHANLSGANLSGAVMNRVNNVPYIPMSCPSTGPFIGWKKALIDETEYIVKLLIPEDALRSSATGRKCRCNKAIVLGIENLDGTKAETEFAYSYYNPQFYYRVGETVSVSDFCPDRFKECAPGIHFFIDRQEAVDYIY